MSYGRRGIKSPQEKMSDFVALVNATPHIIPKRIGEVSELCPAIVYSGADEEPQKLYLGSPADLLTAFPHEGIAEAEASVSYRRISAVTILSESGIHLAVDAERTERRGGLEVVQASLGGEFDEIFIGGFSEYPDSSADVRTMCTTGLIRQASLYARLAEINQLDKDQTELALGICISQLANGMPMRDQDVIAMAKLG